MNKTDQKTGMKEYRDFDLKHLPKEGSDEVGPFFWRKFEEAMSEKDRLQIPERLLYSYRMFRGAHWGEERKAKVKKKDRMTINLLFANIQRTVANITAKAPVAEVVDLDGNKDQADEMLSAQVKKWNNESESAKTLASSVLNMETYGITIEKAVYDPDTETSSSVLVDPFAFAPAPGYYEELNDCPYLAHAYPMPVEMVESLFDVEPGKVEGEESLAELGKDREDNRPIPAGTRVGTQNYPGNYTDTQHPASESMSRRAPALCVEIWVRDRTTEKIEQPVIDPETGEMMIDETTGEPITMVIEREKYPGGIRVVTMTNRGRLVLADRPNPNINPAIPREITSKSYLYDHFPFYKANSYEDTTSIWGFSAAEQVGDINQKFNELLTRLSSYLNRVTLPPLIVPKDSGITLSQINNKPGLVLQPTSTAVSSGIRYMQVPNLPSNFFEALNWYVEMFDRVSQIEDADRGVAPQGVIAAQAIVALQERGAVMMRAKIRAVDYLVRQRGRCAISFFQNFGQQTKSVDVQGDTYVIRGIEFAGRQFNYIVESGSTVARTTLQTQEQAMALYDKAAIDRRALLETLNFPGWKEIVERAGETQLDQALQILIDAGLDEQTAMELRQFLAQPQGGPGDAQSGGQTPSSRETRPPQPGEVNA